MSDSYSAVSGADFCASPGSGPEAGEVAAPEEGIFSATVTVLDYFGLHARPAASLARAAQSFKAEISLCAGERTADAKSMLEILSLAAARDTRLLLQCRGADAGAAGEALVRLFASRLNPEQRDGAL
jgi:phosphocarrier protein